MSENEKLQGLKAFILSRGWTINKGKDILYGEQFVVSDSSDEVRINYWTKKSNIQLQGKDSSLKETLQLWLSGENVPDTPEDTGIEELSTTAEICDSQVSNAFSSANASHDGRSITLELPIKWKLQYYQQGFWRFQFNDGGILDWYSANSGKLDVRGKPAATSYKTLKKIAYGKIMRPRDPSQEKELLEKLEKRLREVLPPQTLTLQAVIGIGWNCLRKMYESRFSFTDGSILLYYPSTKALNIQGTPSPAVRNILEKLPSPFYPGIDKLLNYLMQLFPDWELGKSQAQNEEGSVIEMTNEQSNINKLNWQAFWPENQEFRQSASGREDLPCQKSFLDDWASVLAHHNDMEALLAQAPTGLGKTIVALVPALAWVAEEPDQRRIYYLVNRVSQHDNPINELRHQLADKFQAITGKRLRVVDLIGRSNLCIAPEAKEISSICKQSRDQASFENLPDNLLSWKEVQSHVHGQQICPYHLLQGLMAKAHLVICDYWWLFSEVAKHGSLQRLSGVSKRNSILIVDEAHNLPLRVRGELDVDETFEVISNSINYLNPIIRNSLEPLLQYLQRCPYDEGIAPSTILSKVIQRENLLSALKSLQDFDRVEQQISLPERLIQLLLKSDAEVVFYKTKDAEGIDRLVFKLIDPTPILQNGYSCVHASLTMSGTLAGPNDDLFELEYQVPLFGLPSRTLTRQYLSPFSLKNQQWIYNTDTYGVFSKREQYIPTYVQLITEIGKVTPGITAVFFSSYQFLEQVKNAISDVNEKSLIISEVKGSSDDEMSGKSLEAYHSELIEVVKQNQRGYLFAIYQGKIAEGANFPGNLIKTVICISVPLEYPGLFHQKLKEHYTNLLHPIAAKLRQDPEYKAYEYAVRRFPLSLVLQACGRGIRSLQDRCTFVLLDSRYGPGRENYDWRGYLNPPPYNLRKPYRTIQNFHSPQNIRFDATWDNALLAACKGE